MARPLCSAPPGAAPRSYPHTSGYEPHDGRARWRLQLLNASWRAGGPSPRVRTDRMTAPIATLSTGSMSSGSALMGGGRGCGKRTASSSSSGGRPWGRSHARLPSGCDWPLGGWRVELAAGCRTNRASEALREHRRLHDKRRLGGPTKPYNLPEIPPGKVNLTDPDSRRMKGNRRYIQGYNAQAVASVTDKPMVAVADAQYWNEQHMDDLTGQHGSRADSARLSQTRRRATRLDGCQVLAHAPRPGDRPRARDVPKTPCFHRTGLRSHQTQPQDQPLQTTAAGRQSGGSGD